MRARHETGAGQRGAVGAVFFAMGLGLRPLFVFPPLVTPHALDTHTWGPLSLALDLHLCFKRAKQECRQRRRG